MRKFIFRSCIPIISAIIAFIVVFFFVPFIFTNLPFKETVSSCPPEFASLCNLKEPVILTLYGYLQYQEQITSLNWKIFFFTFVIGFVLSYGVIKLIAIIIQFPTKNHKRIILAVKVLAIAAISYTLFIVISLILSFYGYTLTLGPFNSHT